MDTLQSIQMKNKSLCERTGDNIDGATRDTGDRRLLMVSTARVDKKRLDFIATDVESAQSSKR